MSIDAWLDECRRVARLCHLSEATGQGYPSTICRCLYSHGLAAMLAVVFGAGVSTLRALPRQVGVAWKQYDANPFTFKLSGYIPVSSGTCASSYFSINVPITSINDAKG